MIKIFTNFSVKLLIALSLLTPLLNSQTQSTDNSEPNSDKFNNQIFLALSNANSSLNDLDLKNKKGMSLAIDYNRFKTQKRLSSFLDSIDNKFKPWESEKHFWLGVGEVAILEFIPWALARWIRNWEDPADNWAKVSKETWWRNISHGWEYDGDNFATNNFAHPYHGALFFNAGRTNGYDFWESSAFSLVGSAMWEFFGETFRPAFNDWIYTGIGGANLGEIIYRLSSMVTDNRATGSERVWSEIFGTLINPVRGFNRAITGEMGKNFDNPKWSRPDDFLITFDAGTRNVDLKGVKDFREKEIQGLFGFSLVYGNKMKARKPFDFFAVRMALSSALPHFTQLTSTGYLFGSTLKKNKHKFGVTLDFTYNNLLRENFSEVDTTSTGFIYGATVIHPYLLSIFPIGTKTDLITQIGINGVLIGATPNDYFRDVEGRNYDFGPGVGLRLSASIRNGIWDYIKIFYYANWFWTQTEPSDSKHQVHWLWLEAQYPITKYFSFGIGAGVYWRNSYYEDLPNQVRPDVFREHPIVRVFFRTAIIDL
jgi:Domain of unknown function (DUF3943)